MRFSIQSDDILTASPTKQHFTQSESILKNSMNIESPSSGKHVSASLSTTTMAKFTKSHPSTISAFREHIPNIITTPNPFTRPPTHTPSRSLTDLALRLATQGPIKTLPTPRRIRILFNGAMIADTLGTSGALYVWEHDYYPQFYLPMEAFVQPKNFTVHMTPGSSITDPTTNQIIGGGLKISVKRNNDTPPSSSTTTTNNNTSSPLPSNPDTDPAYKHLTSLLLFAADLAGPSSTLRNMVKIQFSAVDQWYEEDTPIYIHPKDPFKRIDLLTSTRPIRILLNDTLLAHSPYSIHLYETTLPPRYYLPMTAVDNALLRTSETRSQCPYKGDAGYYSVVDRKGEVHRDILWVYTTTTVECAGIAGLCCFYNEVVDVEFWEGGRWRRESKPETPFI